MSTPVICHVSSAKPQVIEKIFATDPAHPGRTSGSIEFNALTLGHSHLAEVVFSSDEWKVFEDDVLIAKGHRQEGERMVAVGSVKTPYLQTFLNLL